VTYGEGGARLRCGNCGARFERAEALVSVADAEAHAAYLYEDDRADPICFERAEELVGATVRDSQGREWVVEEVGEKDGWPTIGGKHYWDRPDEVTVLRPAPSAAHRREERSR
jgi:hypothetical protein